MDQGSEWWARVSERQTAVQLSLARLLSARWSIAAGSLAALSLPVWFFGAALPTPALRIAAILFTISGLAFGVARIIAIKREISHLMQIPALDLSDAPSEVVATLPADELLPEQATSVEHLDLILSADLPSQIYLQSTRANRRRTSVIHLVGALGVLLILFALTILLLSVLSPASSDSISLALALSALTGALPAVLNTSALTVLNRLVMMITARRMISAQGLLSRGELSHGGGDLTVLLRQEDRIVVDPNMFPHVMQRHRRLTRWLTRRPPRLLAQAWLYAATGAIAGAMAIVVAFARP